MDATTASHAFHAFEHAGWEAVPQQYDDAFASLTSQSIKPMLDAVGVREAMPSVLASAVKG